MSRRSEQLGVFTALLGAGVEYAVVGGVAVNAHGFVRNTHDLDLFFRPTLDNAQALFKALEALGAPLEGLDASDLLDDEQHYQLTREYGRIDLLASIGEMSFDRVWRNCVEAEIDGVRIQFISKQDLIDKQAPGRTLHRSRGRGRA